MKKKLKTIIIVILIIILGFVVYQIFIKSYSTCWPYCPGMTVTDTLEIKEQMKQANENNLINKLLENWKEVQSKFFIKAGESGTYNAPDKLQFISSDTLLVHYDDGLADHNSVLQFKDDSFVELSFIKNKVRDKIPGDAWKEIVNQYGDKNYSIANYIIDSGVSKKVMDNIFPYYSK